MKRTDFMNRVRGALGRDESSPVASPPPLLAALEQWDSAELVETFKRELMAVAGQVYVVKSMDEAKETIGRILETTLPQSYIRSSDNIVDDVLSAVTIPQADNPADADLGISGVRYAIAATGTIIMTSESGRRASLLPMSHLAVIRAEQILPSMAEALEHYKGALPTAWVQATGPSRTADIELTLTTGVHGPGIVHAVVIHESANP